MTAGQHGPVLREIARLFGHGSVTAVGEGPLLRRFVERGDQVAFEALVQRHGPMVLGVCRRMLRDASDVEDAFQATFLVLVRKAGSIRDGDQLGPWLYGVASRVAARARTQAAQRPSRERQGARSEAVGSSPDLDQADLRAALDEEIQRLPEAHRKAIVLCYLEGCTHEEAARRLRWTIGMLRGRLERARERLRSRLLRRGFAPTAGLVASALTVEATAQAVPPALIAATVAVANQGLIPGGVAAAGSLASVYTLAHGVLRTMFVSQLKLASFVLAAGAALVALPLAFALDQPSAPVGRNRSQPQAVVTARESPKLFHVSGRVLDQDGHPIAGARVARGSDLRNGPVSETSPDKQGRFTLPDVPPGELILTVQAHGHAPDLKRLVVDRNPEPVEFRLGPGHTIRGRLVDPHGKPIVGAPISVDTWRGLHSLRWRTTTDADGWFRWDEAPADRVLIDLGSLGHSSKRYLDTGPRSQEASIVMPRPLRVRGTVTDAQTGQPIRSFTLVPGVGWGNGQSPSWRYDQARSLSGGSYDSTLSTDNGERQFVRIEAEGYAPAVSRGFQDDEGEVVFDARLRREAWVEGMVRRPDGTPQAGADVMVVKPTDHLQIYNGELVSPAFTHRLRSGKDGRFAFPRESPPCSVVVLHDRGFAIRTGEELAGSREVILEPWGQVEGLVRVGSRPGAGQELHVASRRHGDPVKSNPYFWYSTKADADGRFVMGRVVPDVVTVSRATWTGPKSGRTKTLFTTHSVTVEVKPGTTAHVIIGGTGRPVVGRVTIPAALADRGEWWDLNLLTWARPIETAPAKASAAPPTHPTPGPHYPVLIQADGSFRVDDVAPGVYRLLIRRCEPPGPDQAVYGDVLASIEREVIVPEMPGGRSDEPLDLGTIALKEKTQP